MIKKAVGYMRVSTDHQVNDGISLDVQRAKIRAWCKLNSYRLSSEHIDAGISGSRIDNRPALTTALADCQAGDALVIYSLSRLARSTLATLQLAKSLGERKVDLVSLTESLDTTTAAGKMIFGVLAVLAEFERDQLSERTSAALQHKRNIGEVSGTIPYGKRLSSDGLHVEPHPEELATMAMIATMYKKRLSLRAIAANLTSNGLSPRSGGKWHPQTISNIVRAQALEQRTTSRRKATHYQGDTE